MTRRAVTLVEILVVIAIIAVIAAILFPVFRSARERAKIASCMSNLSQIGKSHLLYAGDNDGYVPPYLIRDFQNPQGVIVSKQPVTWKTALGVYGASDAIFYCPSDRFARTDQRYDDWFGGSSKDTSYEQIVALHGEVTMAGWRFNIDSSNNPRTHFLQDRAMRREFSDALHFYSVHDNASNILFVDGRVKTIKVDPRR
jgi:prepilin-type N-terminal cleavage/methylation domain-containing protein/prepilin-type processing-associated H-X9-DG protein